MRLALVEFLEPSEARKAFTKLAYTKYKHLPLYLEWAPDNSFITPAIKNKTVKDETNKKTEEVEKQEKELSENDTSKANEESEDEDEPEPDTTLFVKNINFATTEEQLKTVNNLT